MIFFVKPFYISYKRFFKIKTSLTPPHPTNFIDLYCPITIFNLYFLPNVL